MLGVSRRQLKHWYAWSDEIGKKLPPVADMMERAIILHRRRYRRLASLHVGWFRAVGGIEIVLSVILPLLFLYPGTQNNIVLLATVSVTVAAAASLRGFYGWDQNWQLYRYQELILAALVAQWEIAMLKIIADMPSTESPDSTSYNASLKRALDETATILQHASEALDHEHNVLFNTVRPPEDYMRRDQSSQAALDSAAGP